MSPEVLKLVIVLALAVCIVVAIIVAVVMSSSSGSSSSSESSTSSTTPSYEDLPSPSESGSVPADSSAEVPATDDTSATTVPSPSDSTIAFKEPGTTTETPAAPVVPKKYYLRLQDAYGAKGDEDVEVWYSNPATKKRTKLQTLRMGKTISKKNTFDVFLSDDVPVITDVSFYLKAGSTDAYLPFIYIVEKEGTTVTNTSENFAPILYNNSKKYVKALYWSE